MPIGENLRTLARTTATVALASALLVGCGGDDEPRPAGGSTGSGDQATSADVPEFTCEFAPFDNPDLIGVGNATVIGTSDEAYEQLVVDLELTGPDGTTTTSAFMPYVQPGEEIAQWAPVVDDSAGNDLTCEVTNVSSADLAGEAELDPAGAECSVAETRFGGWELTTDFSGVEGYPSDTAMFVGTVIQQDGKRYQMDEQELAAGETGITASVLADSAPTCVVRYVRPL